MSQNRNNRIGPGTTALGGGEGLKDQLTLNKCAARSDQ